MNFENPPTETSNKNKTEAFDEKWYGRFEKIAAFQEYEYLVGNKEWREKQKKEFLAGKVENPELDYPELEKLNFTQKDADLLQLKKDILDQEDNKLVKRIYRWRINEKLAELRMLRETKKGSDKRFSRYSRFIYGNPEKTIYEYTINQIKKIIDQKISDPDMEIKEAANRLNQKLFDALMNNENEIKPEDLNLPLEKPAGEDREYHTEEIKQAFEAALERYKLSGWEIIVDKEGKFNSINVSQEQKKVTIPETRKLKGARLQALIEHEIGTHVARREKGERTKLKLLGLGLDRYLKGEEGVATYQEQQIEGAKDFSGFDGHLAISLASGSDGKKRNFREVFSILKDYYFIQSKKSKEEAQKSAEDSAWDRCIRTFRGTTCRTPGTCLTKDIVYREGNIGVWNVVKNNLQEIRRFSVGKYDPGNPRHIWMLDQLGITDDDLTELNKQ